MSMQRRGHPPAHPSLPPAPHISHNPNWNNLSLPFVPPQALSAGATAARPNPYAQFQSAYSSHYAQAYMQSNVSVAWPSTTGQDYPPSSTFTPGGEGRMARSFNSQSSSSWYQPGNTPCTYKACNFSGSHKAVEIHMMDRHLIYPPGWENKKRKSDWDADPSLKGKPIPIQGTTIILDTPEVLDAWIAERKKRWPSAPRVEDKKRKLEEAVARGQLSVDDSGLFGRKRGMANNTANGDGRDLNNDKKRHRGRSSDSGWRGRGRGGAAIKQSRNVKEGPSFSSTQPPPLSVLPASQVVAILSESSSDEDAPPEISSSKPLLEVTSTYGDTQSLTVDSGGLCDSAGISPEPLATSDSQLQPPKPVKKVTLQQPKKPLHNPFATRPTLLRNLLLPEIRITVSNLSQAIRFLVDNNFLDGVEMKPGEANEQLITVVS